MAQLLNLLILQDLFKQLFGLQGVLCAEVNDPGGLSV